MNALTAQNPKNRTALIGHAADTAVREIRADIARLQAQFPVETDQHAHEAILNIALARGVKPSELRTLISHSALTI